MRAWTLTRIVDIDRITETMHRKLVFLVVDGDKEVNAKPVFDRLDRKGKAERFRQGFHYWLGKHDRSRRHHGFDPSQHGGAYTGCYVFRQDQDRLFGFLCHPDPDNPRQEFCVLVHIPKKKKSQHEVDTRTLDLVNRISAMPEVKKALSDYVSAL